MDSNLSKALWIGVSILLFIAVVTIGISIFSGMKEATTLANDRIGSITQGMAEEEFRMFDGKEVKGDDVLSALGTFSGRGGDVIVLVATLGNNGGNSVDLDPTRAGGVSGNYTENISETSGDLTIDENCVILETGSDELDLLTAKSKTLQDADRRNAEDPNLTTYYINPSGRFVSHLIYDENMKIRGVIFAQQE